MEDTQQKFYALKTLLGEPLNKRTPIDRKGNITFHCPNCKHRKNKLTVNVVSEVYNCWVCEFRGVGIRNMLKRLRIDLGTFGGVFRKVDYENKIDRFLRESLTTEKDKNDIKYTLEIPKTYSKLFTNYEKTLFQPAMAYLESRGLTLKDTVKYTIYYSPIERRVLFPSYDLEGNLNYYISRAIYETEFRYNNADVPKENVIFNEYLVDWGEDLYIVEGIFDAIISRKNATIALGCSIPKDSYLMHRIKEHQKDVIFCFDPDAFNKLLSTMEYIAQYREGIYYVKLPGDKDIAELGTKKFDELPVMEFNFKNMVMEKLSI